MHKTRIRTALRAAGASFDDGELAYLALAGKVDRPLTDRLAWELHIDLGDTRVVGRDWHGADIAILEEARPEAVVTVRGMYSFEAMHRLPRVDRWISYVQKDLRDARRLGGGDAEIYEVLLITHVAAEIPAELDHVVKFRPRINRALGHSTAGEIFSAAKGQLSEGLAEHGDVDFATVGSGTCWGVSAAVSAFVVAG